VPLAITQIRGDAAPTHRVWFLHGFMGRGQNWQGFARRLVEQRPELSCRLVDLRKHGDSQELSGPHTIAACVADLRELARVDGAPNVVVGHSFGGRVALAYAEGGFRGQLWVLDAAPASSGVRAQTDTGRVFAALRELPARFADRRSFVSALRHRGAAQGIAMWLAKNLEPASDGLRFALDLDALGALLEDHDRTDCWGVVSAPPPGLDLRFVLAGPLSVLSASDRARLLALADRGVLRVRTLQDAGHWLHVDDPAGLLALLADGIA
jgi:pimeloyl-ACP methyl ester carboxylesterase